MIFNNFISEFSFKTRRKECLRHFASYANVEPFFFVAVFFLSFCLCPSPHALTQWLWHWQPHASHNHHRRRARYSNEWEKESEFYCLSFEWRRRRSFVPSSSSCDVFRLILSFMLILWATCALMCVCVFCSCGGSNYRTKWRAQVFVWNLSTNARTIQEGKPICIT